MFERVRKVKKEKKLIKKNLKKERDRFINEGKNKTIFEAQTNDVKKIINMCFDKTIKKIHILLKDDKKENDMYEFMYGKEFQDYNVEKNGKRYIISERSISI